MPVFIAHRGNYTGAEPDYENKLVYLKEAYACGFGVECDLQVYNDALYLGHDEPQEIADYEFLQRPYVFCHAKTVETMHLLMTSRLHCFWHEEDKLTLTSQGYMWCYPGVHPVHSKSIWLDLLEKPTPDIPNEIFGVCGDNFKDINWIQNKT